MRSVHSSDVPPPPRKPRQVIKSPEPMTVTNSRSLQISEYETNRLAIEFAIISQDAAQHPIRNCL